MVEKDIICTVCPTGCIIHVTGDEKNIASIEGFTCQRGKVYGKAEFLAPVRTVTSTVKVEGSDMVLVACRTKSPIPKEKMYDAMKEIQSLTVKAPVKRGDVLIANVAGSGVDVVATGEA